MVNDNAVAIVPVNSSSPNDSSTNKAMTTRQQLVEYGIKTVGFVLTSVALATPIYLLGLPPIFTFLPITVSLMSTMDEINSKNGRQHKRIPITGSGVEESVSASNSPSDFYTLLGVHQNATERQISTAFKRLALDSHPDHQGDGEDFKVIFVKFSCIPAPI